MQPWLCCVAAAGACRGSAHAAALQPEIVCTLQLALPWCTGMTSDTGMGTDTVALALARPPCQALLPGRPYRAHMLCPALPAAAAPPSGAGCRDADDARGLRRLLHQRGRQGAPGARGQQPVVAVGLSLSCMREGVSQQWLLIHLHAMVKAIGRQLHVRGGATGW